MGNTVDYANGITVDDLDTIYITGGGYVNRAFKGIDRDSAMGWEEPVWGGDLTRSTNFVLSNIDTVDFGMVARVELSFKYMNEQDYIALCNIAKQRFCTVNYYSRDLGQRVSQEMAFTSNEISKLYAMDKKHLGMLDVKIKLVATNREKAELIDTSYTITYNSNGGSGTIANTTTKWSEVATLDSGENFTKSGYKLAYWATKDTDGNFLFYYNLSQQITVWNNLDLYAVWEEV